VSSRSDLVPLEWRRALVLYVLPLAYFASLARTGTNMVDGDTYLHLAAGRWILEHRQFIHSDFFSYTFAGTNWNDPEWLSEVAMAALYGLAGWSGLALLFSAAFGLTSFLIARYLLKFLNPLPAFVVLELSNYCIAAGQSSRPYALALPIMAVWTMSLLEARSKSRAPSSWLLPLMTVWSNLHGSFLLGIGLVGAFAAEAFFSAKQDRWSIARAWLVFAGGSVIAAAINPNGISGLVAPIAFLQRPILSGMLDWASTSFSRIGPFEISVLLLLGVCIIRPVRMSPWRLLVLLGIVHMALSHRRHMNVFATVAPILLAEPLSHAFTKETSENGTVRTPTLAGVLAVFAALMIAVVRIATPNPQENIFSPSKALEHVPAAIAAQPVFNQDILGGFLIWHGIKSFIDSRQEMVTDAFFENYTLMCSPDRAAIIRTFARYRVGWAILLSDNSANAILDTLPGWHVLYRDGYAVVHVRGDLLENRHRNVAS
jgi:hypothetical protein